MKLLIVTQKVDTQDPVLGFFHRWIVKFAEKVESVVVICIEEGGYQLPSNVKVISLGKEKGVFKIKYVTKLWKHAWRERKNYSDVFVHMNQEHVLSTGIFWRVLGKKIGLWYNHKIGTWKTRLAVGIADRVFYTSPQAFTSRYKKAKQMPVGIDECLFRRDEGIVRNPRSILSLGRISKVKRIDLLVSALKQLHKNSVGFGALIVGSASQGDGQYYDVLRKRSTDLISSGKLKFIKSVLNIEAVNIYNQNRIFVNLTQSGSFDKTILEAMACECLVVTSNDALLSVLQRDMMFEEGNVSDLAKVLMKTLDIKSKDAENIGRKNRDYVLQSHTLDKLVDNVLSCFR